MITTPQQVEDLCGTLSQQPRIAVDLEGNSLHHYKERLCLMQISDVNTDYIIDLMALEHIDPIVEILQDPKILKVMHGSDYDVVSLKRDYDCSIVNLFDTGIAAQFLNYSSFGLSNMIWKYFGVPLDKKYQKHDWSRRPLYEEHIEYARGDTHFLLALHDILQIKLERTVFWNACVEESECLTKKEWNGRQFEGHDYLRLKQVHKLSLEEKSVLRALFELREEMAKERDIPVHFVAPNDAIVTLSRLQPQNFEEMKSQVDRSILSYVKKHPNLWLEAIQRGLEDQREIPILPKAKKPKLNKYFQAINTNLREWRTQKQNEGAAPISLLNNQQIKNIALAVPQSVEQLSQVSEIRKWQVDLYGDIWMDLLQAVYQK